MGSFDIAKQALSKFHIGILFEQLILGQVENRRTDFGFECGGQLAMLMRVRKQIVDTVIPARLQRSDTAGEGLNR